MRKVVNDFVCRDVDEIVLSYVLGIIEDLLEEDDVEEAFDTDSFMEMIVAYLPQLEGVEEEKVKNWMMSLVKNIHQTKQEKASSSFDIKMLVAETTNKQVNTKKIRSVSETSEPEVNTKKRSARLSETSEADDSELEAGVATLLDMFPTCCKVEAVHCLTIMAGDLERAAQMILTRAEMGEDIKLSQAQLLAQLTKPVRVDESEIKRKIMDNYGFVDTEHDNKYHRPIVSKKGVRNNMLCLRSEIIFNLFQDDKKLIRYREGKIVSTKGERFSQVTKEESQEMKKSIVNINFSNILV